MNCMVDIAKHETHRSEAARTCQVFNNLRRGARGATDARSPAVIPDKVRLTRTFRNALRVAVKRFGSIQRRIERCAVGLIRVARGAALLVVLSLLLSAHVLRAEEVGQLRHWAFRPVLRPPLPPVTNAGLVESPVDAFIMEKLEAAGLKPAALAC